MWPPRPARRPSSILIEIFHSGAGQTLHQLDHDSWHDKYVTCHHYLSAINSDSPKARTHCTLHHTTNQQWCGCDAFTHAVQLFNGNVDCIRVLCTLFYMRPHAYKRRAMIHESGATRCETTTRWICSNIRCSTKWKMANENVQPTKTVLNWCAKRRATETDTEVCRSRTHTHRQTFSKT